MPRRENPKLPFGNLEPKWFQRKLEKEDIMFTISFNLTHISIEITAKTQYIWVAAGSEPHTICQSMNEFRSNILAHIKSFCYNNGVVAWIDENGCEYIAPSFIGLMEYLEKDGYRKHGFLVPFSNGERFVDGDVQERWEKLRAMSDLQIEIERKEEFVSACRKAAGLEP